MERKMAGDIDRRLMQLGIELPEPAPAWANYLPYVATANLVFVSGQLSQLGAEKYKGKLGRDLTVRTATGGAARLCAINLLPHLKLACRGKPGPRPALRGGGQGGVRDAVLTKKENDYA
jgi:hypothetical protein